MKRIVQIGVFISLILIGLIKGSVCAFADPIPLTSANMKSSWSGSATMTFGGVNGVPFYAFVYKQSGYFRFVTICFSSVGGTSDYTIVSSSGTQRFGSFSFNSNTFHSVNGLDVYYNSSSYLPGNFGISDGCYPFMSSTDLFSAIEEFIGGYSGPADLGYIIPSYTTNSTAFAMDLSMIRDSVSWDRYSTSGFDLDQNGVTIEFAYRDKSYYMQTFDGSNLGTVGDLATRVSYWLQSNIYPDGSADKAFLRGDAVKSSYYGKYIPASPSSGRGSNRTVVLSPASAYNFSPSTTNKFEQYCNYMFNGQSANKSWYQHLYDFVESDYKYQISYDLYARIVYNGQNGNWLKITNNGTPIQEVGNRLDGSPTISDPVSLPSFDPSINTWQDSDEVPQDSDDDYPDNIPVGYYIPDDNDPNSGDNYYVTNNYTYNYDNRSWIENHYTNQDISDTNQGIDIFKFMIKPIIGIFVAFFGALFPAWVLPIISICAVLMVGIGIFKIIKGVIPFV